MNVLLLSQFFSTTKGGGEYVFSVIAESLLDHQHKVWVITNRIKRETYLVHKNLKIVFVPPLIEYKGGLPTSFYDNMRYSFATIRKGLSIIKNENIDIVHSNNFAPAFAGSILASFTGKPHITTIHDIFSLCGKDYWKLWGRQNQISKINVFLAPFFEKMVIKLRHEAIHTVSEASYDDLVKFGTKKPIFIIPNAIKITERQKNVNEKQNQFVYIGRLVFYKNLEVVLKAINLAKQTYPKVTLIIVGDGPHRENLEKLVKDLDLQNNVKFVGFVSNEEKYVHLASSRALVFPSLCEGFGLVVLEAFSQKKPVLVSDVKPLSDIVSNKQDGYILSPNDEKEWADAIISLIENQEVAKSMGLSGYETLKQNYSLDKMYEKIISMYKQITK